MSGDDLTAMHRVASDAEAAMLDDLAVRAGILRRCDCGAFAIPGEACEECGSR